MGKQSKGQNTNFSSFVNGNSSGSSSDMLKVVPLL